MFNGVKVFSATKQRDRDSLGEHITCWIQQNKHLQILDRVVTQSSDHEFHCLTITLFYNEPVTTKTLHVGVVS